MEVKPFPGIWKPNMKFCPNLQIFFLVNLYLVLTLLSPKFAIKRVSLTARTVTAVLPSFHDGLLQWSIQWLLKIAIIFLSVVNRFILFLFLLRKFYYLYIHRSCLSEEIFVRSFVTFNETFLHLLLNLLDISWNKNIP